MPGGTTLIHSIISQLAISISIFNETFFLYYEETELAFRAKQFGYNSVILNEAKIIHYGSKSFKDKKEYLNHLWDGQLKFFKITKKVYKK